MIRDLRFVIGLAVVLFCGMVGCQTSYQANPVGPSPVNGQESVTPTQIPVSVVYTPTSTATVSAPAATYTPSFTATASIPIATSTPSLTSTPVAVVPSPTPFPAGQVVTGTDANLDQIISQSPIPVMVEFWASWCPECVPYGPVVTKFAKDFSGQVLVVRVDVDQNPGSVAEYNVTYIPITYFFNQGAMRYGVPGAASEATLEDILFQL